MINLHNKDCLEFLRSLDDNSIDLVVADPPYFEIVKNDWDNQWSSESEYLEWCQEWTAECVRVLKPERCLYVWGTTKTDTFLKYKLNVLNSFEKMNYQSWVIWAYDWGGRTKKNFPRKHEDLLMYSKGKSFLFNTENILVQRAVKTNMNIQRKISLLQKKFDGKKFSDKDLHSWKKYKYDVKSEEELHIEIDKLKEKNTKFAKGKIPTDVWTKNNHTTSKEYCGWHPTQKPISLLERIILANTNEGDTVLDCFSGTGSTMIASELSGRNFVGCEVSREYYEKSLERKKELT